MPPTRPGSSPTPAATTGCGPASSACSGSTGRNRSRRWSRAWAGWATSTRTTRTCPGSASRAARRWRRSGPGRKPRCWTTWPSTRATGPRWRTSGWSGWCTMASTSWWPAHGRELAEGLHIPAEHLGYVLARFLDTLRRLGALRRPLLAYHPYGVAYPDVLKAAQWERRLMKPVGLPRRADDYPALRHEPGEVPDGIEAKQFWSQGGGFRTSAQKVLTHLSRRLADAEPDAEGVARLLELLAEYSLISLAKLHGYRKSRRAVPGQRRRPEARPGRRGPPAAVRHLHPGRPRRPGRRAVPPLPRQPPALHRRAGPPVPLRPPGAGPDDRGPGRRGAHRPGLRRTPQGDRGGVQGRGPADEPAVLHADAGDGHRRRRPGRHRAAQHPAAGPTTTPSGAAGPGGAAGWAWSSATPAPPRTTSTSSTTPPR